MSTTLTTTTVRELTMLCKTGRQAYLEAVQRRDEMEAAMIRADALLTAIEAAQTEQAAAALLRMAHPDAGMVEVMVSPQKIRFEFGQASLTSKVIDGAFPDYMRVIPKGNDKQADIDNTVFASAVDRVATISAEKSRSVKLAFELDRVTLTVRNMEAGQGVEEVEIGYSEEPFEIGFNARYLLDVAGQITGETAHFKFADPASPTLVLDPGDPGVQYVLMPLRV